MAKRTAPERRIEIIQLADKHDVQALVEAITEMAEKGLAYVCGVDRGYWPTFVVSNLPLSPRRALKAFRDQEREEVREFLLNGEGGPGDALDTFCVSGADVGRIAKQEGIKLPRNWFSCWLRESEAAKAQSSPQPRGLCCDYGHPVRSSPDVSPAALGV